MKQKMNADELNSFMKQVFAEVADQFLVQQAGVGTVSVRMAIGQQHLRPGGTVSGPAIFSLADVTMYLAILGVIGPVALAVTTNCSIDFMRKPAAGVDLIGKARVLKLGRVLAVGDVLIYSKGVAEPVARASLTYSIPPAA